MCVCGKLREPGKTERSFWTGFSQFIDYFSNTPLRRHSFFYDERTWKPSKGVHNRFHSGCETHFPAFHQKTWIDSVRCVGGSCDGGVTTNTHAYHSEELLAANCIATPRVSSQFPPNTHKCGRLLFFCWPYRRHWNAGSNKLPSKMRKNRAPVCVSVQMELIPLSA